MKFLGMVLVNCKKYLKNLKNIVLMFIVPIVCLSMIHLLNGSSNSNSNSNSNTNVKVGILTLDKGNLTNEFMENLGANSIYDDKETALRELKNYNLIALYEIPANFSVEVAKGKKPKITVYKLEEGNTTEVFEANLEQRLNQLLKVQILRNNHIAIDEKQLTGNLIKLQFISKSGYMDPEDFMPVMLILFFLLSFSSSISMDLLTLRKEKILERFLSTNNSGFEIMGSIYISMILVQVFIYTLSFLILNLLFKLPYGNFGILILNISLMSMISISLGIMLVRIFKEPGVASLVINMVSLAMFFLYIGGVIAGSSSKVPSIILTLSKFTPFYWAMESIEKSILFPNGFILLLISLTFFSAGSIKFSSFAKR